ncbi:hypothetical protein [Dongia sedimenti]|uniref:Uncharacterized protein n=1 Tax=Dongia sedimenti TaxID=3064282 RepID=A0ABU0YTR7_9PROT|nr:hypothetical protein [Rhodospirillaceae bacterium R-7]
MNAQMPWLLGALVALTLATAMLVPTAPATAKEISMPPLSRSTVENACNRAGGRDYGVRDEGQEYGCISRNGSVNCTTDGQCVGYVSDLLPVTANSIDAVLGLGVNAGPIKLGPKDSRVVPQPQP